MDRRHFLKTLGAASLALPGLDLFGSRLAFANSGGAPKRFIAVMGALGMKAWRWVEGTESNYQLGPNLAALEPYKSDITILRGLQPRNADHYTTACFLTGHGLKNGSARVATIDQVIAARHPPSFAAASGELVRSIEASLGYTNKDVGRGAMVFAGPGREILPKNNPADIFDRLFVGGESASTPSAPPQDDEVRRSAERSIVDAHLAEIAAINAQAGTEDRVRLQAHLDGLRTIERELGDLAAPAPTGSCAAPSRYAGALTKGAAPYDRIATAHCDIIGRAFACDITRVATLQMFYDSGGDIELDFLESRRKGIGKKSIHDTKHDANVNSAEAVDLSDHVDNWYAEVVAYLLDQLNQPDPFDPNGGRILDNTVLLFGSNIASPFHGAGPNHGVFRGEHNTTDTPFLIAGSAGGALKTGRYFDHRVQGLYYGENGKKHTGGDGHVHHNRLLVSLLNAFGENVSTYGDANYSRGGALPGLMA